MPELALAVAVGAFIAASAALLVLVPWELLLVTGTALLVAGLAVGVPAGIRYHVLLHRVLAGQGSPPPRWWLRPTAYHGRLPVSERPRVMRPFYLGALGFFVILVGCVIIAGASLRAG